MTRDKLEADDMDDLLCDQTKGDICIILSGCGGNGKIIEFHAPCPIFMGIDEKSSIRDKLTPHPTINNCQSLNLCKDQSLTISTCNPQGQLGNGYYFLLTFLLPIGHLRSGRGSR